MRAGAAVAALVCLVVVAATAVAAQPTPFNTPVTVTTALGDVSGYTVSYDGGATASHNIFWGIPFGESTAGANRWMPPVPKAAWAPDTLNATAFRDACPQSNKNFLNLSYSEDCLHLNIWAPVNPDPSPAPVLLYIHGGGYFYGTGADPVFFGDFFANHTNTVLVTINYRLGALGFLNTAELAGNYGTMDQQLAMQWVHDHIRAFGGDPTRVTIWGQSAGGMSIATHLYIPSSFGLYSGAILDSNPAGLLYRRPADNVPYSQALARDLLCSVDNTACLRSRSWEWVVDVQLLDWVHSYADGLNTTEILIWGPVVDGTFFPDTPWNLLASGRYNTRVPVLMGSMRNDSFGFVDFLQPIFGDKTYDGWLKALFKTHAPQVLAEYPAPSDSDAFGAFVAMATDYLFACPIRRMAELMTAHGTPNVWLWYFMHVPTVFPESNDVKCTTEAVCHSAELAFIFDTASQFAGRAFTPAEQVLAQTCTATWATYARTQSLSGVAAWAPWSTSNPVSTMLDIAGDGGNGIALANGYRGDRCDFWDSIGYIF